MLGVIDDAILSKDHGLKASIKRWVSIVTHPLRYVEDNQMKSFPISFEYSLNEFEHDVNYALMSARIQGRQLTEVPDTLRGRYVDLVGKVDLYLSKLDAMDSPKPANP